MSYDNPWLYDGVVVDSEILDDYIGFVYEITNLTNNRKYIGKKLLRRSKTKQVKGKKKRTLVESDWKDYYGSNKELQEDVANIGIANFRRVILKLCKSKGECSYYEAKYQFTLDVLVDLSYYNSWISCKIHRKHLRLEK